MRETLGSGGGGGGGGGKLGVGGTAAKLFVYLGLHHVML